MTLFSAAFRIVQATYWVHDSLRYLVLQTRMVKE
jgi:hypothetical protein